MWFVLVLVGSLIALVVFAFMVSRRIEYGEARFDSTTGKLISEDSQKPAAPVIPARRIEQVHASERETDNE